MNPHLSFSFRHGLNNLSLHSSRSVYCSRNLHWFKKSTLPRDNSDACTTFPHSLIQSFWDIMSKQADKPVVSQNTKTEMVTLQRYLGLQPLLAGTGKEVDKANKRDVVFVSIDLEAFEFAQNKITEIGVSVLDTRDIVDTDPGVDAISWLSRIKTRHFRISEYARLVNKRFIKGCPDKFNFGESEFISIQQTHNVLTQIFANPAGAHSSGTVEPRNIVLVGHGLSNDTAYLKSVNFSPYAGGNVVHSLDTQKLSAATKKSQVGLEKLIRGLGVTPVNLHNAGNDAAYTLQSLVLMGVKHAEQAGSYFEAIQKVVVPENEQQKRKREARARRKAKLAEEAAAKAAEEGVSPAMMDAGGSTVNLAGRAKDWPPLGQQPLPASAPIRRVSGVAREPTHQPVQGGQRAWKRMDPAAYRTP